MLALVTGARDFFLSQFESTGQLQQVVGIEVTLVTRNFYTGEGATIPAPRFGPGDGGKPPEQPPTQLKATVLGVVAGDDTTLYFPLPWTRSLLDNRRYDMTDADRKA